MVRRVQAWKRIHRSQKSPGEKLAEVKSILLPAGKHRLLSMSNTLHEPEVLGPGKSTVELHGCLERQELVLDPMNHEDRRFRVELWREAPGGFPFERIHELEEMSYPARKRARHTSPTQACARTGSASPGACSPTSCSDGPERSTAKVAFQHLAHVGNALDDQGRHLSCPSRGCGKRGSGPQRYPKEANRLPVEAK